MRKPIKIAVADDQLLFRKGFIALLKDFPELDVAIESENGKALMDSLKTKKVAVVLLDLEMPVMDGFEATEHLKKKHPEIKVIILTSHNEETFIQHLLKKGAHGFLLKDQDIEIVVDAIYGVIENGYYFNDMVSKAMVKGLVNSDRIRPNFNKTPLSPREIEIIKLISLEYKVEEIAKKLFISVRTVNSHKERIIEKTNAKNAVGIVMYAIKNNLLDI